MRVFCLTGCSPPPMLCAVQVVLCEQGRPHHVVHAKDLVHSGQYRVLVGTDALRLSGTATVPVHDGEAAYDPLCMEAAYDPLPAAGTHAPLRTGAGAPSRAG